MPGGGFAAQVPGSAHTDLLTAGLIDDPYLGLNEAELAWMHRADWRYQRELALPQPGADERADLVFDGLDTVATITLADAVVGRTFNQHRTFRFDIRDQLATLGGTDTTLAVHFRSALDHAEAEAARVGARPAAYLHPLNMVRKMACSFGWDWGPDLQTAGIWRPVRLERWRIARLASVRPLVSIDDAGAARVSVHVDVERSGLERAESPVTARARLTGPGGDTVGADITIEPGTSSTVVDLDIIEPALWWPVGYGEQPLYDLDVTLHTFADAGADTASARSLAPPDRPAHGASWTPATTRTAPRSSSGSTGTPIFVKGANWIPDDHLLTRITRAKLARRIDQAVGANLNLLRVWGGGIYESEDFYELCDEAGIMVWQDFLLACAAYPEEEPHRSEFEAEAREHVARLTAAPQPGAVERRERKPLGLHRLGLAGTAGRPQLGIPVLHGVVPTDPCRIGPHPALLHRKPVLPRRCAADDPPERPRPRHPPPVGGLEPGGLHRLPRRDPPVLLGVRFPGSSPPGRP